MWEIWRSRSSHTLQRPVFGGETPTPMTPTSVASRLASTVQFKDIRCSSGPRDAAWRIALADAGSILLARAAVPLLPLAARRAQHAAMNRTPGSHALPQLCMRGGRDQPARAGTTVGWVFRRWPASSQALSKY
jgi:hypothetical protein